MSRDRLQELIKEVHDRHRHFHAEFNIEPRYIVKGRERPEIIRARSAFFDSLNRLFLGHLDPLRRNFAADPLSVVDQVIHFLEIDIPAFRCGYEKEWYLRKLKKVALNYEQQKRLRDAALAILVGSNFRRELREWARLMIVLADAEFIFKLKNLSDLPDHFIQKNAQCMLLSVLDNRPDLNAKPLS